jgi:NAD(P)-dependent dehydrogenase (short-subunit alcohol dehydrogenase family)
MTWKFDNIPDQTGRVAIVTGANAGIGFAAAEALARKGARVVLACRSRERGTAALEKIVAENPSGSVELQLLDLASMESVRAFAADFTANNDRLDLLINNAGVMIPPESKTEEGFELQIGVNFLGHFALTGLLFDLLDNTDDARIVTLSSLAHRGGRIDFDSWTGPKRYRPWRAYGQSKLACLMFTLELQRRLDQKGSSVLSLGAHPGGTKTDLQRHSGVINFFTKFIGMSADQGALPTLYAATEPTAEGGEYIGPNGFYEARGYPEKARIAGRARNEDIGERLWQTAEQLTGVSYLSR